MSSRPATRSSTTGKRPARSVPSANDDVRNRKKKRESQEKRKSDAVYASAATQSQAVVNELEADVEKLQKELHTLEGVSDEGPESVSSPSCDINSDKDFFAMFSDAEEEDGNCCTPPSVDAQAKKLCGDADTERQLSKAAFAASRKAQHLKLEIKAAEGSLFWMDRDNNCTPEEMADQKARIEHLKEKYKLAAKLRSSSHYDLAKVKLRRTQLKKVQDTLNHARKQMNEMKKSNVITDAALHELARKITFE